MIFFQHPSNLVLLVSAFALVVSCRAASIDPLQEEKNEIESIRLLAKSIEAKDRLTAAQRLIGLQSALTPFDLVRDLINDSDFEVQLSGYGVLQVVASVECFTHDEVKNLMQPLRVEVTRSNIDRLFTERAEAGEKLLLIEQAAALNSLYFWRPLVSVVEFEQWQREVYSYLILRVTSEEDRDVQLERGLMLLVGGLFDSEAIMRVSAKIVEGLLDLSPQRIRNTLQVLWRHPVVGEGRPMNTNLKNLFKPKLMALKRKVVSDAADEFETAEALQILDRLE